MLENDFYFKFLLYLKKNLFKSYMKAVNFFFQKIEKFISSGKKGTILMSLGTNIRSDLLGEKILTNFIRTFASLPEYNFIWKFESKEEDLPIKLSKNVMIGKFLPQNDILAHPKIVGFVSHAGQLSTHEALYHGVPVIGELFFSKYVE